jgi:hypothetical protein
VKPVEGKYQFDLLMKPYQGENWGVLHMLKLEDIPLF